MPTFRDTAVDMAEFFKMPFLLHLMSLAKLTPCKRTEEKTIKYYLFNKHRLVTHPTAGLCGLHMNI